MSCLLADVMLAAVKRLTEAESFVVGPEEISKIRSERDLIFRSAKAIKIQCW